MGIDALIDAVKFVEYQTKMMASQSQPNTTGIFPLALELASVGTPQLYHPGFIPNANPVAINFVQAPKNNPSQVDAGVAVCSAAPTSAPTSLGLGIPMPVMKCEPEPQLEQHNLKKNFRTRAQLQRHCEQVKCQRAYLKGCLDTLRHLLNNMDEGCDTNGHPNSVRKSSSTSGVLEKARKEIEQLQRKEAEHLEQLKELNRKSDQLRMELMQLTDESCDLAVIKIEKGNDDCDN